MKKFMKKTLTLSFLFLFLISCSKKNVRGLQIIMPITDTIPDSDTTHRTYLALGDSYTIGSSVSAAESFPVQTAALLRKEKINVDDPQIIAVNGWTTVNLLNALNTNPPRQNSYTLVTLLIGVNNQYQGGSLDDYKNDFAELLSRAVSYAGGISRHVFVLSIPDYSVTPFANGSDRKKIASEIDAFNAANKSISIDAGVHYIDVTGISRMVENDPYLTANDGLHPSGLQYARWSALLAPEMLNALP